MGFDEPQEEAQTATLPPKTEDRVLIIDDDEAQAVVLSHRFASQGFQTLLAHTGEDGKRLAIENHPDLIFLDLRLPDSDGLEICQHLNDHPETCEIPVIILSGREQPDVVRRARAAGCQYYVRKPYDPNALLLLAENAIKEGRNWF